ncbi:hypothetical protein THASP1DRAFT_21300 [Thamnocephalis sphaerospora]|uniref:Uncharacterized protein n=1 Tax=Thamnocephalis sphaerospora TaxID=78915 RepID=A0A4P9XXI2_9FUNG|nr:hypothetical protein THASP1DRAFT_21300 [Thamnocephalis sphaerospora]|eukprot:RKP11095.1 hypothetical protein THASP1DRAFT_21300 [Thamnocephalis sphaerospora]
MSVRPSSGYGRYGSEWSAGVPTESAVHSMKGSDRDGSHYGLSTEHASAWEAGQQSGEPTASRMYDGISGSVSLSGSATVTSAAAAAIARAETQRLGAFAQGLRMRCTEHEKRAAQLRAEIQRKISKLEERQRRLADLNQQEQELRSALLFAVQRGVADQQDRLRSVQFTTATTREQVAVACARVKEHEDLVSRGQGTIDRLRARLDALRQSRKYRSAVMRRSFIGVALVILLVAILLVVGHTYMEHTLSFSGVTTSSMPVTATPPTVDVAAMPTTLLAYRHTTKAREGGKRSSATVMTARAVGDSACAPYPVTQKPNICLTQRWSAFS